MRVGEGARGTELSYLLGEFSPHAAHFTRCGGSTEARSKLQDPSRFCSQASVDRFSPFQIFWSNRTKRNWLHNRNCGAKFPADGWP